VDQVALGSGGEAFADSLVVKVGGRGVGRSHSRTRARAGKRMQNMTYDFEY
jgi:hypothetical protein